MIYTMFKLKTLDTLSSIFYILLLIKRGIGYDIERKDNRYRIYR